MKKLYATLFFALMAMTSFAQEKNDTTYVMFDFNQNPWNYPVSTKGKGWGPDYDDETGAIFKDTDFTWPIAEGSSKLITVTCYAVDLDEYPKPAVLWRGGNADIKAADGSDSIMTMLFTNNGTTMRFKAPEGYKFGKMLFYNYRSSNFLVGDEYGEEIINDKGFKETLRCWVPESPKVNSNDFEIWQGDATNILFVYQYFSAHFMKIDIRLVPNEDTGISDSKTAQQKSEALFDLQGRRLNAAPSKGLYIVDGKKIVK